MTYYINTGEDLSDNAQVKVNVQLMQLVRSYLDEARQALRSLGELEPRGRCAGKEKEPEKIVEMEEERRWKEQRDVLVRRWEQIEALLDHAIERMKKDQDARVISQKQGVQ
ncbi:hypothetical protein LTR04_004571 [Oleoguttula sp. CCFEE 6159]|nr:hypothetical protein LTR04_004571 [Oleoguttula sp. CCFEE 6159]